MNSGETILCGEQCEKDHAEENPKPTPEDWRDGEANLAYRSGYDYACGYHA